jgi:hypothetical protein
MKRTVLVLLIAGLLVSEGVAGEPKSPSLQGVWQAVAVTMPGPVKQTIRVPEPRANLTMITARHFSRMQVEGEGAARPAVADVTKASADDVRAAWGPFYAEAGTYEITGHVITLKPIVAKNAAAMMPGAFTAWSFTLEGNTLRVTAAENQNGPIANPPTITLVRVE